MTTSKEYEASVLKCAAYFTAVRGRSPFDRQRVEFASLDGAIEWAKLHSDKRTMIYAVTGEGRDAHICNA